MHEELGRFDVELLADVFSYQHQILAALAAGAGFRLMAVFNPRQMLKQGLPAGPITLRARCGERLVRFRLASGEFRFVRRDVAGQCFLEQIAGFGIQGFALDAKAHPPQVGQFQRQRLNLGLGGMQFRGLAFRRFARLRQQFLDPLRYRRRNRGIGNEALQFSVQLHAAIVATESPPSLANRSL